MPSMLHFDSDEQTILGNASNSSGIIQFLPSSVMNDYNETVIYLYIKGKKFEQVMSAVGSVLSQGVSKPTSNTHNHPTPPSHSLSIGLPVPNSALPYWAKEGQAAARAAGAQPVRELCCQASNNIWR